MADMIPVEDNNRATTSEHTIMPVLADGKGLNITKDMC